MIPVFAIITSALGLSLDSFFVSIPLGIVADRSVNRRRLAMAFGICDGIATLAGAALASLLFHVSTGWFHEIGPALIALYGVYVVVIGWYGLSRLRNSRTLYFLAVMLSFDNLIAGSGLGGLSLSSVTLAVMAGLISGAMAFAGFSLGAGFAKGFPAWCPRLAGPLLILVACILLLS